MLGPDKRDDDAHSRETELGSAPTTPYPASSAAAAASGYDPSADSWRQLAARFEILNELGRGGMGIVYQARDRETGAAVAIKVLKPEIASAPELIGRFKTELLLARKITHKNVCRVYDLHRFGPVVAIGMEFVEGESLRSLLGRVEGLSIRHGLKIARQLIAGLAEAHGQGVIHRDLKPENILIASDGTVKVMDFGIARSAAAATITGSIMGTPAYMSPEQAEGKPADARSDIYSLGLILYEMFTGQRAFHADTPVSYAMKQIHETPTPPAEVEPHLPPFLARVILRCLEKNPKQRFQSAAELDIALTETQEAITPTPESAQIPLPPRLAYWQRSDWTLLLSAVAAAALFFVLFYRFHPAPVMDITVTDQQQNAILGEILKKLNAEVEPSEAQLWFSHYDYYALASKVGVRQAQQVLANERQVASWQGNLLPRGKGGMPGIVEAYSMDIQGRLLSLYLPSRVAADETFLRPIKEKMKIQGKMRSVFVLPERVDNPPRFPPDTAALAGMKDVARRALAVSFGTDVSTKEPDETQLPPAPWSSGATFVWRLPMKSAGLVESFGAWVDGSKVLKLARWLDIDFPNPQMFQPPPRYSVAPIVVATFALMLFFWQRVYRQERSYQTLIVALLFGLCVAEIVHPGEFTVPEEAPLSFLLPAAYFLLGTLVSYAALSLIVYYLRRRLPVQISNYLSVWRKGLPVRSIGLELLRGIFAGMIATCAWMGLVSLGGLWGKAFVGMISFPHIPLENLRSVPANFVLGFTGGTYSNFNDLGGALLRFYVILILTEVLIVPWLLAALPLSLLVKVNARVPVLIAALVGLWLALGFSLAGAMAFPRGAYYFVAAFQAAFFGVVFLRYGLLATSSAALTVETALLAFPLFTIFKNLYPFLVCVPLAVWFVMFLGAGGIYLQPQLATAYRRVVGVFE